MFIHTDSCAHLCTVKWLCPPCVLKKRAALALLRLIRKTPSEHNVVSADSFSLIISSLAYS